MDRKRGEMQKKSQQKSKNLKNHSKKNVQKKHNSFIWIAVAAVIIFITVFFVFVQKSPTTDAKLELEIPVAQAHDLYQAGAFILDVRQPDEYSAGHIPGAVLVPLGELPDRLSEVPRNEIVVVVCRSGNRSATGRDILLHAGYPTVSSMAGGMNEWINKGYETKSGAAK